MNIKNNVNITFCTTQINTGALKDVEDFFINKNHIDYLKYQEQ